MANRFNATVKELKAEAKARGIIKGYSKMKKTALAIALTATENVGKDYKNTKSLTINRDVFQSHKIFVNSLLEEHSTAKAIFSDIQWAISSARTSMDFERKLLTVNPYKLVKALANMKNGSISANIEAVKKYLQIDEYEPTATETEQAQEQPALATTPEVIKFEVGQYYGNGTFFPPKENERVYRVLERTAENMIFCEYYTIDKYDGTPKKKYEHLYGLHVKNGVEVAPARVFQLIFGGKQVFPEITATQKNNFELEIYENEIMAPEDKFIAGASYESRLHKYTIIARTETSATFKDSRGKIRTRAIDVLYDTYYDENDNPHNVEIICFDNEQICAECRVNNQLDPTPAIETPALPALIDTDEIANNNECNKIKNSRLVMACSNVDEVRSMLQNANEGTLRGVFWKLIGHSSSRYSCEEVINRIVQEFTTKQKRLAQEREIDRRNEINYLKQDFQSLQRHNQYHAQLYTPALPEYVEPQVIDVEAREIPEVPALPAQVESVQPSQQEKHQEPKLAPCPNCGSKKKPYHKHERKTINNTRSLGSIFDYYRLKCRDCGHEVRSYIHRSDYGSKVIKRTPEEAKKSLVEIWNRPEPAQEVKTPEPVKETPKPAEKTSRKAAKKADNPFSLTLEGINACETKEEIYDYLMNAKKQQIIDFCQTLKICLRGLKGLSTKEKLARYLAGKIPVLRAYEEKLKNTPAPEKPAQTDYRRPRVFETKNQQLLFIFQENGNPYPVKITGLEAA